MTSKFGLIRRRLRSVESNLKLFRLDPESFGRNLLQLFNPALFEARLADVLNAVPMHVCYDPTLALPPRLNVLDSAWTQAGMTGGPNTVINLALRLPARGVTVRLVATVREPAIDATWFASHAASLTGASDGASVPIVSAADPSAPLIVGPNDMFLATHWTTALQLKAVLPQMRVRQFFYMLQEFEPGFYAWSSNFALALETFGMDFWPIINESLLAEYLLAQPFGRLSDRTTRERAIVFEPAVDGKLFHPGEPARPGRRKRLLFYARPTNTRNMFGIGLLALRQAAANLVFDGWEFLSIGSRGSLPDLSLGNGHVLRRAPWMDYAGYGDLLREADILLCPMLSPHTSYPVLEMAACGGTSVTNVFATKTAASLLALSENILPVEATVEGFSSGLLEAAFAVNAGRPRVGSLALATDWHTALEPAVERVADVIASLLAHAGSERA
jgi:hypothetical protein